jgi:hypothetical protein
VVAPTSIVTTPTMVANMPLFLFCSASNTAFSASAAGAPTTPASCATIAARAAASPNTTPARAVTIISSGASEKAL